MSSNVGWTWPACGNSSRCRKTWYPQPNSYSRGVTDCVWGNIPRNAGDIQTARFFEWVYPGYETAASHPDERGKIVNTPFGDSFDVILSNAGDACLAKYRCVILLGTWRVTSHWPGYSPYPSLPGWPPCFS